MQDVPGIASMDEMDALKTVLQVFQKQQVPHAISGSLSSNAYGDMRSTKDADIIIDIPRDQAGRILDDLTEAFEVDRQLRWEGVTGTSRFVLRHRASRFIVELFFLGDDPFDQSRFSRRVPQNYLGLPTFIMSPEDVVVQKTLWLRKSRNPKHRGDVANVLRFQSEKLDWEYINRWTEQHGTRTLLDEIRQEVERVKPANGSQ